MRLDGDGYWRKVLSGRPSGGDVQEDVRRLDYLRWVLSTAKRSTGMRHVTGAGETPVPELDLLALDR